ncbi:MAG: type II toxin-antitoxin system prevent-host-death family antitoxin [Gemmatimonadales bacterium]|nr:type II toxin-antitoxin system prevent-host-death family antitoxin [Gemmatimonadota bacterium]MCL4212934.1 type II toxin-antitoxin system prevent-host-death family antitoxin [Gemmatimonadales bacterium]
MSARRLVRITTTDAREEMAELVNGVAYGGARIVLQRHGRNVAALVSIDDLKKLGVRIGREIPPWTRNDDDRDA